MKTLIYSDVHGNLPAFEKMLLQEKDCERFICLGDLVNYGPWSNECVDLAMSLPSTEITIGNHEEAFINGFYEGTNQLVHSFFNTCFPLFTKLNEIKSFQNEYSDYGFVFKHTIQDAYIYPDTKIILDNNYIIGHSHHQFVYKNNEYTLYNPGSVGQNRKQIQIANYIVLDSEKMEFSLKELVYDIDITINEMRHRNYPIECIEYYLGKIL